MKYKKENDNRYRVDFMPATEDLMDAMTVSDFISYLEENAEFEDNEDFYIGGHIIIAKVYCLYETEKLSKEFIVTPDGRVFYWISLIQMVELVDDDIPEGLVDGLQAGDKYRNAKCVWLVDSVYTVDAPDILYKVRIKSHVIKKSPTFMGSESLDCGYRERA